MWDSQQSLGALYIKQCIQICISLLQQFATHGSLPVLQSALCIDTDVLYTSQLANNLQGWDACPKEKAHMSGWKEKHTYF